MHTNVFLALSAGFCANAVCMENENMIQKKIGKQAGWSTLCCGQHKMFLFEHE